MLQPPRPTLKTASRSWRSSWLARLQMPQSSASARMLPSIHTAMMQLRLQHARLCLRMKCALEGDMCGLWVLWFWSAGGVKQASPRSGNIPLHANTHPGKLLHTAVPALKSSAASCASRSLPPRMQLSRPMLKLQVRCHICPAVRRLHAQLAGCHAACACVRANIVYHFF